MSRPSSIARDYVRDLQEKCDLYDLLVDEDYFLSSDLRRRFDKFKIPHPGGTCAEFVDHFCDGLVSNVCRGITHLGLDLPCVPLVAFLPTLDFNACAALAPDGYPIVLLEIRLWDVASALAKAITELIIGANGPEKDLDASAFAMLGATAIVVGLNRPEIRALLHNERLEPSDKARFTYIVDMTHALVEFVVAHEFAHHILGHLGEPHVLSVGRPKAETRLNVYSRAKLEEFEADALGYRIFLATLHAQTDGRWSSDAYQAFGALPLLLMRFFAMVECVEGVRLPTHPAGRHRARRLRNTLKKDGLPAGRITYISVARFMNRVLPTLCKELSV